MSGQITGETVCVCNCIGIGRWGLGGLEPPPPPPNIFLEGAEPPQYFRPDSC